MKVVSWKSTDTLSVQVLLQGSLCTFDDRRGQWVYILLKLFHKTYSISYLRFRVNVKLYEHISWESLDWLLKHTKGIFGKRLPKNTLNLTKTKTKQMNNMDLINNQVGEGVNKGVPSAVFAFCRIPVMLLCRKGHQCNKSSWEMAVSYLSTNLKFWCQRPELIYEVFIKSSKKRLWTKCKTRH